MVRLKELSSEELADLARRGIISKLAVMQQELIEVLDKKAELLEKEIKIRQKLEEI